MSNKVSRAVRRSKAYREQKQANEREKNLDVLEKTRDEIAAVLEHEYTGIIYGIMSIVLRRNHISRQRIYKMMGEINDMYGLMHSGEILTDDLIRMCKEESGILVDYDESKHYALLSNFTQDKRTTQRKIYSEISGVKVIEE